MLETLFWILFAIVAYTYLGYALFLYLMVKVKQLFCKKENTDIELTDYPDVCLFVTAYNEMDFISQKLENTFSLNYPKEKIQYVWVTDGSDDGSPDRLKDYPEIEIYHQQERRGKMHAMNRGMQFVKAPIVIFSDCNTMLGENAILEIVKTFANASVGCVAGEKRILEHTQEAAVGAGESAYWKFESWVKSLDSELNTAVGAVGELFAIRRELFDEVEEDTLLDDFIISLRIAMKGYKIAYVPNAYAIETASISVAEEMKRKKRIAAGGIQTLFRLKQLLNPLRFGILSWQYISHKVLRWTIAPLALFLLPAINLSLLFTADQNKFLWAFFILQFILYFLAFLGFLSERKKTNLKVWFVPYYFTSMNYAAVAGWLRFMRGKQSVKWEKAKRA